MKHFFFSSFLALATALTALPLAKAAPTPALVQASQPTGAIVVPSKATAHEKRAAENLQTYLQKCTGAESSSTATGCPFARTNLRWRCPGAT